MFKLFKKRKKKYIEINYKKIELLISETNFLNQVIKTNFFIELLNEYAPDMDKIEYPDHDKYKSELIEIVNNLSSI